MQILTGQRLAIALSCVRQSIALRDVTTRHKIGEINAEQTIMLLAAGRVEAIGRGKKLRFLRALDPSIRIPKVNGIRQEGWRCGGTYDEPGGAAVLWPWMESRGIPLGLDGRPA